MLRQTFQGKDILIIHNIIKGNYIVIYEGETVEVDQPDYGSRIGTNEKETFKF